MAPAPLESGRFGMKVFRGSLETVDAKGLKAFLLEQRADLAIIRTPGGGQRVASQFERMGFPFLHADVLLHYEAALQTLTPKPLRNADLEFVRCDRSLADDLSQLVRVIFADYRSHYMANPLLPVAAILEGFQEWAVAYATSASSERCAWLVRRAGRWVAFATCSVADGVGEGVLYGVHPDHAGGGLYTDLVRFTQNYLKGAGARQMLVSTQAHNLAVQKVWSREGFALSSCLDTWHINSMLSYSVSAPVERQLVVDAQLIEAYAQVSGDHNPIHFDDTEARARGLPGRIAHALVANGWLSQVLGMDSPGPGTLFRGYRYLFLSPMLPQARYSLRLSTLKVTQQGACDCLARISDDAGRAVLLAYLSLSVKAEAANP